MKKQKASIKKNISKKTSDYHESLIEALRNPNECIMYLKVAVEEYQQDHNVKVLLIALRNVAEARGGVANLAKKTRINRQSLYKILSSAGNPTIDTFGLILKGLGFHLSIEPNHKKAA